MKAAYFAFDVETTGLDPVDSEIISLAAILLDSELNEIKSLEAYALPDKGCPPEAARINGYEEEKWKARGALSQADFYNKVATFVSNEWRLIPIGHNVSFDVGFLKALFKQHASGGTYNKYFSYHTLDTIGSSIMFDIAKQGKPDGRYKLGKLCERFGIRLGEDAHDAKADVRATVELLRYLIMATRGDTEVIPPKVEEKKRPPFIIKTGETYRFNKGKFQGRTLGEVATEERGYLMWVLREITDLDDDAKKAVEAKLV